MGCLRTILAIVGSIWATSALAEHSTLHDRFADCTGRMSAQLEHEWLLADSTAARTQKDLERLQDLLGAVTPTGRERETLARRIEAKHSQKGILTRATFNDDPEDAARARRHARKLIAACQAYLHHG